MTNSMTGGKIYDMRQLSAGEKTVFYLFLYLNLVGRISVMLIDELENHMHEDLICKFASLMNLLSDENITYKEVLELINAPESTLDKVDKYLADFEKNKVDQIFLFTHSKVLIYAVFNLGKNFVLNQEFSLLDYETCERKLREVGISSIYNKVLFVEGEKECELFDILTIESNVRIEKVGNCEKLIEIYRGINEINSHIKDSHFVFMLDSDVTNEEKVREYIGNEQFILLERHEIENYMIDIEIWKETAKSLASDDVKDEITNEYIEGVLKEAADSQLDVIRKLYICNKIRDEISDLQAEIKHRDIPANAYEEYNNYINRLFDDQKIENIRGKIINKYNECNDKYDVDKWNLDWIKLCPGKQVVGIASRKVGVRIGVTQERFMSELMKNLRNDEGSPLNILFGLIKEKLQIQ